MVPSVFFFSVCIYFYIGANIVPVQGLPRGVSLGSRIVGGQPADITKYPYQVSFELFEGHHCGAAILNENWVVTAAHCVDGIQVFSATFRAGSRKIEEGGSVHEASEIIMHPLFDYKTLDYDIAVVKVSTPFVFGIGIQPIALATEEPSGGEISVVTGWGSTKSGGAMSAVLMEVAVHIVDHAKCESSYAELGKITQNMICAGEEEGGKDSCQGDSGGPLVVDGKLAGIVSWGAGCAIRGYPGIYTNVAEMIDFVSTNTTLN